MGATASGQYPTCLRTDEDITYCDEAKLTDHLTQNLNYNENGSSRANLVNLLKNVEKVLQQQTSPNFRRSAAEEMSIESFRVLQHSLEHSQLIRRLSHQDRLKRTALHWCARHGRNEVIKVILDSVSEEECYQLLSIRDNVEWTPLYWSCLQGDIESVKVMLNHINQEMRYSLLQITDEYGNTPLHFAPTDVIKVIHKSVTQSQWINLLQMKGRGELTVLQAAAYWNTHSCVDTIRDSVSDEEWLQLVSTPLPEYTWSLHYHDAYYQEAVNTIDKLRAAARVKSVLQTENNSGMLSHVEKRTSPTHVLQQNTLHYGHTNSPCHELPYIKFCA